MRAPRIMLAGTHSGAGKTTITTALMGLLRKKGYQVNPFKVGPDYIDPSYHRIASGRTGRNLDCWMVEPETVYQLFYRTAARGGINVIEGVMGLFDGSSATSDEGSSAQVAKLTGTPVILIVDVRSSARSAAAMVLGFQKFDPELNVAGVIVNRVGSDRHLGLVTEAIEKYCGIPVVGCIRKNALLELPSRHLGLIPTVEGGDLPERVDRLADIIEEGLDLERILAIAEQAPELREPTTESLFRGAPVDKRVRIGLAFDESFSFYYQDGLDLLEHLGADLVPFSPIHDKHLPPDLDGLYIGGGYPEIYLEALSGNKAMLDDIRGFGVTGRPIFGECGGLMYLSEGITDVNGNFFAMVGLVPGKTIMKPKLVSLGYVTVTCRDDNLLGPRGTMMRGHEFHYSEMEADSLGGDFAFGDYAFELVRNRSKEELTVGFARGNLLASYVHIHFATNPAAAASFVDKCRRAGRK